MLAHNPSHLESAYPVLLGMVRYLSLTFFVVFVLSVVRFF